MAKLSILVLFIIRILKKNLAFDYTEAHVAIHVKNSIEVIITALTSDCCLPYYNYTYTLGLLWDYLNQQNTSVNLKTSKECLRLARFQQINFVRA